MTEESRRSPSRPRTVQTVIMGRAIEDWRGSESARPASTRSGATAAAQTPTPKPAGLLARKAAPINRGCAMCGKEGKAISYDDFLGCDVRTCNHWVHASCLGFVVPQSKFAQLAQMNFKCKFHK